MFLDLILLVQVDKIGSDFVDIDTTTVTGVISYSSLQITNDDIEKLCKITYAERGGGTQAQQEYVVSAILNRVLYSRFPNTVEEVISAPNQFESYSNGSYDRATPTDITKAAVNNVVQNGDTSKGAIYFMTPAAADRQDWLKNCIFLFNDGDNSPNSTHNFYTNDAAQTELQQYIKGASTSSNHSSSDPDFYSNYKNNISSSKVLSLVEFALSQEGKNLTQLKTEYNNIWIYPYDNWCADFVSFCFQANGLVGEGKAIPYWQRSAGSGYKNWVNDSYLKGNYIPKPGDVIVFSWSHVGLVYACDGNYVYVIEGNSSTNEYMTSVVSLTKYQLNSNNIYGYYPSSLNIN